MNWFQQTNGLNDESQRQRLGMKRPVVCKPKVSTTTLGSRAAPNCRTGQSIGRSGVRTASFLFLSIFFLDESILISRLVYGIN